MLHNNSLSVVYFEMCVSVWFCMLLCVSVDFSVFWCVHACFCQLLWVSVCFCINLWILTFIHSFMYSFMHPFMHSFIHSFTQWGNSHPLGLLRLQGRMYSCIHSFIHTLIHTNSLLRLQWRDIGLKCHGCIVSCRAQILRNVAQMMPTG